MVKKKESKAKGRKKKILKTTPIKSPVQDEVDVFNDSCVTKFEVLPPKNNNYYERQFIISSISGNQYTVTVNRLVHCTCPNCTYNAKRCKHIEFVMQDILHRIWLLVREGFLELVIEQDAPLVRVDEQHLPCPEAAYENHGCRVDVEHAHLARQYK